MIEHDIMHVFILELFYLCLHPPPLNPTPAHHYQPHPPSMIASSPLSSSVAVTGTAAATAWTAV